MHDLSRIIAKPSLNDTSLKPACGQNTVNMSVSDCEAPEPLPPVVAEIWMCKCSSFLQLFHAFRMANMHASSALWIGERPDLTVLVSDTSGTHNVTQAEGVTLKLHRSVLSEYEYFKQRFDAQPDVSEQDFRRGTYCHVRIILTLIS